MMSPRRRDGLGFLAAACAAAVLMGGCAGLAGRLAPAAPAAPAPAANLKDEMRMPWSAGEAGAVRPRPGAGLAPAIVTEPDAPAETLSVRTDAAPAATGAGLAPVKVEVIAPGGRAVAETEVPRGQVVRLRSGTWPDGPYEVRCTSAAPDGRRIVRHLAWYKGDALAHARRIVETAPKPDPSLLDDPEDLVHMMLADLLRDRLGPDLGQGGPDAWQKIHPALMEFEELSLAKAGDPGGARPYGFVRLAWRDPVDDSPQFCRAYLPADYTPARKWPLVVNLHGYNPPNPLYVRWWGVDQRHVQAADRFGFIQIEPHGRGNTSYLGIGDRDVVRAIEVAKARFSVDADRVYLTGYSMGGGGTWHVGTRHPELFGAVAPVYGGWDYHVRMSEEELARLTPHERFRQERGSSFAQAEALLSTPVFVNHGDADVLVNVDQSRYAVRMLQRWGYDVRYWEHPGLGHGALGCEEALYRWFLDHPRERHPPRVRVRAGWLKTAAAHWLRVEQSADPWAYIAADAEIVGPNAVRLDTENALEVALSPGGPLIDAAKPLRVTWNGRTLEAPLEKGAAHLRAPGYTPGPLAKKPALAGPIEDALTRRFLIVVGTISPDPMMKRLCRRLADTMARQWENWQHWPPYVVTDTEIAGEAVGRYSLILIGGPDANAVTRHIADRLPLRVTPTEIVIDGRVFPAADAAVRMVYPNPMGPEHYVVVTAATSARGMFYAGPLTEDVDFAIDDGRAADAEAGRPAEKVRPASGTFDHAWRLNETFTEFGDPVVRAACPVRKAPSLLSAAEAAGGRAWMSDVLETIAEGSYVSMGHDANAQGRPLRLAGRAYASGLGVAIRHEPCAAEWDLAGAWKRLRGTVGIEIDKPEKLEAKHKESTRVVFTVKGDGKELWRSRPVRWDGAPQALDVDVAGIKVLRLETANETTWFCAATSADWADVRLER